MARLRGTLLLGALALLAPSAGAAQDVEMLGARYGTPVPASYRVLRQEDPRAFRFTRGRAVRLGRQLAPEPGAAGVDGGPAGSAAVRLGPRDAPLRGTFHLPVLMGLFGDGGETGPYPAATVQDAYFGDGGQTISAYWAEVSRGAFELRGEVRGWVRADPRRTQAWVTNGESGLNARTAVFIEDLLDATSGVDWGRYDNDGPDGIPNSGDDDGFVDALAVLHPTAGGECGGDQSDDRIWSHRWSLSAATGSPWLTDSPSASGGFVQVDDYVIQPVRSCSSGLNEIGVFTHELGHAFGLPDLYDTVEQNGRHQGAGTWELMATGSWGCDDRSPDRPCHLGAWSKAALGWVDVVEVPAGTERTSLVVPPVASTGTVYRVRGPAGSEVHYLLENRRRTGFDANLPEEGLLVWQVDEPVVAAQWRTNEVNGYDRRGIWLRQADGLDDLGATGRGRGDAGDPFPLVDGERVQREFHAGSTPSSRTFGGTATGVTFLDIARQGADVALDVLTRLYTVTLRKEEGGGPQGVFSVDGSAVSGSSHSFLSAPFDAHEVEAAPGELVEEGVRRPFAGWLDDPEAPRVRTVRTPLADRTVVARYAGEEVELALDVRGGVDGVTPAELVSVPHSDDLWFPRGTEVSLEARPRRGFRFVGWTGALAGAGNPALLTVDEPVRAGVDFELTYQAVSATARFEAAVEQQIGLEVENGTNPVTWDLVEGTLPRGLRLDPVGLLVGAALEAGTFPVRVQARDALGLRATAEVTLEVDEPALGWDALASTFLLGGPALTSPQERYLDLHGNADGTYDLGDLRAWVLAHPDLPPVGPSGSAVAEPFTLLLGGGGGR